MDVFQVTGIVDETQVGCGGSPPENFENLKGFEALLGQISLENAKLLGTEGLPGPTLIFVFLELGRLGLPGPTLDDSPDVGLNGTGDSIRSLK